MQVYETHTQSAATHGSSAARRRLKTKRTFGRADFVRDGVQRLCAARLCARVFARVWYILVCICVCVCAFLRVCVCARGAVMHVQSTLWRKRCPTMTRMAVLQSHLLALLCSNGNDTF